MDQSRAPAYRLVRRPLAGGQTGAGAAGSATADAGAGPPGPPGRPRLDQAQQQVVDHAGGPLLVLAGPGTGKTTTIVATVADRIESRGISPERILVLTFSRKAAAELRDLLLRAAERGLDGRGLRQLGKLRDRDDWMAAAAFLDRYAARFDLAPVPAYDYA